MKIIFNILVVIWFTLNVTTTLASTSNTKFEIDGISYIITDSNECEVTEGNYAGSINIPGNVTYNGESYTVVAIGSKAFSHSKELIKVSITDGIRIIKPYGFEECTALMGIALPSSLQNIEEGAFSGCISLPDISLPENISYIPPRAFERCTGFTKLDFSNNINIKNIDNLAFYKCTSLNTIILPPNVETIGEQCFCYTELTSMSFPNSTTYIGKRAFEYCSKLKDVTLSEDLTDISDFMFAKCESLTDITIPQNLISIGEKAFERCNISEIYLPENFKYLEPFAFYYSKLQTIVISPNCCIYGGAFEGCQSLNTITVPATVKFDYNTNENYERKCFYFTYGLRKVIITANSLNEYLNRTWNQQEIFEIADRNQNYSVNVFIKGNELERVIIPSWCNSISSGAFYNVTSLKSIVLPQSIEFLYPYSFGGCINVSKIECLNYNPPTCGSHSLESISQAECLLDIPIGSITQYQDANVWKEFNNIEESNFDDIPILIT